MRGMKKSPIRFRSAAGLALAWLVFLVTPPCVTRAESTGISLDIPDQSGLLCLYDPGIPQSVYTEWSFPTGFSFGISGGHRLRIGTRQGKTAGLSPRMNLFPLSFLMKVPLYKTRRITQSVGVGLGPYFLHQGPMPIQFSDLRVTCGSTYLTEWVTCVTKDLYLNLKMKYTHALQSVTDQIPLMDFTTWLGLDLRW